MESKKQIDGISSIYNKHILSIIDKLQNELNNIKITINHIKNELVKQNNKINELNNKKKNYKSY